MADVKGVPGDFKARLTNTLGPSPLTISQLDPRPAGETPGNVGIALSGGGSRALSAGMGQLRGLSFLELGGKSLLSQTKALSTVSGGSWLGVTWEYLPPNVSDADALNAYVPDPGRLVPTTTPGHSPAEMLDTLPAGNIGRTVCSRSFSVVSLALQALALSKLSNTPKNFLWQALVGLHILDGYGLFPHDKRKLPGSLFSWDAAVLNRDVTGPNPALAKEPSHLVASAGSAGRTRRPYLVCNTAMFLNQPGAKFQYLAPVQATPFFTGIVGRPTGTDANGRPAGGGGVTSFAFSSSPTTVQGANVTANQPRQLALADIVGCSSAAFAEFLGNLFTQWRQDPAQLFQAMQDHLDETMGFLGKKLDVLEMANARILMKLAPTVARFAEWKADLDLLKDIIPEYRYWPVLNAQAAPSLQPTRFADGGNLENTGVTGLLAYPDIDNVIACVNSTTPLAPASLGAFDAKGVEIPNTRVFVDSQIPPLFGYQPFQAGKGYVLYPSTGEPKAFPQGRNSRVFDPASFADFLRGLWQASGSGHDTSAALLKQSLAVQPNPWFGIAGGKTVNVLWVYTNRVKAWYDLLRPDVQAILGDFDNPMSFSSFPHYPTFNTDLTPTKVNLLSSLTSWTVAGAPNRDLFLSMYQ
jgi:hypothetical protein